MISKYFSIFVKENDCKPRRRNIYVDIFVLICRSNTWTEDNSALFSSDIILLSVRILKESFQLRITRF